MIYASTTITMMQRLLFPWLTRFLFTALALSLLFVHPVLCSSTKSSLDQHGQKLGSAVDRTVANRLARAISATPNNSSVAGYSYSGCYADTESTLLGSTPRSLLGDRSYTSATGMTWATCTAYCNGYQYAGITSGSTCKCGNTFAFLTIPVLDTLCSTPCTGSSLQLCGSSGRLTVFRSTNYVSVSSSPLVSLAAIAAVAPSPPATAAAVLAPSTLVQVVSSTTRPPTLSAVSSAQATLPTSPTTSVPQVAAPVLNTLISLAGAGTLFPASVLSSASPSLALPPTSTGPGLSAAQVSTSSGLAFTALIGASLNLAGSASQSATISPSSVPILGGLPLGVSAPTLEFPASQALVSTVLGPLLSAVAPNPSTSTQNAASQSIFSALPLNPSTATIVSVAIASSRSSSPLILVPSASTPLVESLVVPLASPSISREAAPTLILVQLAASTSIRSTTASQTTIQPTLPVSSFPGLILGASASTSLTSVPAQSVQPQFPVAFSLLAPSPLLSRPSESESVRGSSSATIIPSSSQAQAVLALLSAFPSAVPSLPVPLLPSGPVGFVSAAVTAIPTPTTVQAVPVSQIPVAPQESNPTAPVLFVPASVPSLSPSVAVVTPATSFSLVRPSLPAIGLPLSVVVEASFTGVLIPITPPVGALESSLSVSQIASSVVVLPTVVASTIVPTLALPTRLSFSLAPVVLPVSSVDLSLIGLAPTRGDVVTLASASSGLAAKPSGPQIDPALITPVIQPLAATILPANQNPLSSILNLLPADPLAISLPSSALIQQPVNVISIVVPPPAAVLPNTIPLGQPLPSYLSLPPLPLPEPTVTSVQQLLPTVTNLLNPPLVPILSSSNDPGSPDSNNTAATVPDFITIDPDDLPWPFAPPYSPLPQPPILSPSFKIDAQGNLPTKKDITNRDASANNDTPSGVIETGKVIDKVFTWSFYSTGLVQVNATFLSPSTNNILGFLPDGTRIGLDSAGLYVGWEHRVPYGPEMLSVMARFNLPAPQYFI